MSRIGKQPVAVPANVDVTVGDGNHVRVKGPKGQLERQFPPIINLARDGQTMVVSRWLVMPSAAMSRALSFARPSASMATPICDAQISSGSCSTQPAWGKYC